ncbi:MAG: regulatory protein RecX [Firmicutes bacterium]|nr:regulatory protein RecX [Bacillota bacterium]
MNPEARRRALAWLAQRALTQNELTDRLKRRGFSAEDIQAIIEDFSRRHWLDDDVVAAQYAQSLLDRRHWGPGQIKAHMHRRGLSWNIIEKVCGELCRTINWQDIAMHLVKRYDMNDGRDQRRAAAMLARQGFSSALIHQVVHGVSDNEFLWEQEGEDDGSENY